MTGQFASDAYYERRFPVRGLYAMPERRQIPPGEWVLLNYQMKNGLPKEAKVTGELEYRFDTDGDGITEWPERVKSFSVRYQHARTGAEMWMFLEPLSFEDANLNLDVIAHNHVEASSGSGTIAASVGSGIVWSATRKMATRVLDGRDITLDGLPAYVITYEIANVDQLQLSPQSRWKRARVVLVRTPYRWVIRRGRKHHADWPVLAVIGYEADPRVFDSHLPEFGSFAGNFDFLRDGEMVRARDRSILGCHGLQDAVVTMQVDAFGKPTFVAVNGSKSSCGMSAFDELRFAPTGQPRAFHVRISAAVPPMVQSQPPPEVYAALAPAVEPTPAPMGPSPAPPVAPVDTAPALPSMDAPATEPAPSEPVVGAP